MIDCILHNLTIGQALGIAFAVMFIAPIIFTLFTE